MGRESLWQALWPRTPRTARLQITGASDDEAFELTSQDSEGEHLPVLVLDRVVLARFQKQEGHHYRHIVVRFVDGHEDKDMVRPGDAQRFLDAYRDHLRGQAARQE